MYFFGKKTAIFIFLGSVLIFIKINLYSGPKVNSHVAEEGLSEKVISSIIKKIRLFRTTFNPVIDRSLKSSFQYHSFFKVEDISGSIPLSIDNLSLGTLLGFLARDLTFCDEKKIFQELSPLFEIMQNPLNLCFNKALTSYLSSSFFSTSQPLIFTKIIFERALLINSYNLLISNLAEKELADNYVLNSKNIGSKDYVSALKLLMQLQVLKLHIPPASLGNLIIKFRKKLENLSDDAESLVPKIIDSFDDETVSLLALQINTSFKNIEKMFLPKTNRTINASEKQKDCLSFMIASLWLGHQIIIKKHSSSVLGSCYLSLPTEKLETKSFQNAEALIPQKNFISMKSSVEALLKRLSELKTNSKIISKSNEEVIANLFEIQAKCKKENVKAESFNIEVLNEETYDHIATIPKSIGNK